MSCQTSGRKSNICSVAQADPLSNDWYQKFAHVFRFSSFMSLGLPYLHSSRLEMENFFRSICACINHERTQVNTKCTCVQKLSSVCRQLSSTPAGLAVQFMCLFSCGLIVLAIWYSPVRLSALWPAETHHQLSVHSQRKALWPLWRCVSVVQQRCSLLGFTVVCRGVIVFLIEASVGGQRCMRAARGCGVMFLTLLFALRPLALHQVGNNGGS